MGKERKPVCSVIKRDVTVDMISEITHNQQNTKRMNDRKGEEDALEVALKGSKIYLKEHNLLEAKEE